MTIPIVRRVFPPTPTQARALVLRAHPLRDSFNSALADHWIAGAEATGLTVSQLDLSAMEFDPVLDSAYRADQPLEPDLQRFQCELAAASHVVLAFPVWWGSTPGKLKGLFDRALLPGWAYASNGSGLPDKGLGGRSARLLVTMDGPTWYDRLLYGASARRQVGRATLKFCGITPVRMSAFGSIGTSTAEKREAMLSKAESAGRGDARKLLARFDQSAATTPSLASHSS